MMTKTDIFRNYRVLQRITVGMVCVPLLLIKLEIDGIKMKKG